MIQGKSALAHEGEHVSGLTFCGPGITAQLTLDVIIGVKFPVELNAPRPKYAWVDHVRSQKLFFAMDMRQSGTLQSKEACDL